MPPTNPNIICESEKLSLKNSSYVFEDNLFSLKHLKKCVFNPKDAYWKGLKSIHQHHVQLSPLWWLQCKEKKIAYFKDLILDSARHLASVY